MEGRFRMGKLDPISTVQYFVQYTSIYMEMEYVAYITMATIYYTTTQHSACTIIPSTEYVVTPSVCTVQSNLQCVLYRSTLMYSKPSC